MKWLVFSRNRAYQLDAFIRTAEDNGGLKKSDITILHKYDEEFKDSLESLKKEHTECSFLPESNFKKQVIQWVETSGPIISFATDDAIFTRKVNQEMITTILEKNPTLFTLSLRLGMHLDYCYPTSQRQSIPNGQIVSEIFVWDSSLANGDWGYPLSVDGHIFRTPEILNILKRINYENPNTLESNMQIFKNNISPLTACFIRSCYMNVPFNTVQTTYNNRSGKITAQMLEMRYRTGERFDSQKFFGFLNNSAHQEVEV